MGRATTLVGGWDVEPGSTDQERRELLVGRKPPELQLREDDAPVLRHLEGAGVATNEFDVDRLVAEGLLEFGGQTGRLREVVSAHAVFDADLHGP